jgi:malate dehydrogenase (oxaloacetate-decarboxylating)
MADYDEQSLELHRQHRGKIALASRFPLETRDDLSIAYTPGIAAVSEAIHENRAEAYALTMKGNSVCVVSDGSSVLGLGNIGPEAAMPVMEGKAILFKAFADIDAIPLVVDTHSADEMITLVKQIAPSYGGINLEDIGAPDCFVIEEALQDIGIPVFHDDQHGTAIVATAGIMNACAVSGKKLEELRIVINGAGAAGTAIAKLLLCVGQDPEKSTPVRELVMCDSKGIISRDRSNLNEFKVGLLEYTNLENRSGSLRDALYGADVFIGVSRGNLLTEDDIQRMAPKPIILAMANPVPEIMPDLALAAGASVVGTGRSDFPNQVNNVLVFPGIFRGALDARATRITANMKLAAVHALAGAVDHVAADRILPDPLDKTVAPKIAEAVRLAAIEDGVAAPAFSDSHAMLPPSAKSADPA